MNEEQTQIGAASTSGGSMHARERCVDVFGLPEDPGEPGDGEASDQQSASSTQPEKKCAWPNGCDKPRRSKGRYCKEHHALYQRVMREEQQEEIEKLKANHG